MDIFEFLHPFSTIAVVFDLVISKNSVTRKHGNSVAFAYTVTRKLNISEIVAEFSLTSLLVTYSFTETYLEATPQPEEVHYLFKLTKFPRANDSRSIKQLDPFGHPFRHIFWYLLAKFYFLDIF